MYHYCLSESLNFLLMLEKDLFIDVQHLNFIFGKRLTNLRIKSVRTYNKKQKKMFKCQQDINILLNFGICICVILFINLCNSLKFNCIFI